MNFKIVLSFALGIYFSFFSFYSNGEMRNDISMLNRDRSFEKNQNVGHGVFSVLFPFNKVRIEKSEIDKFLNQYPKFLPYQENIRIFYGQRKMSFNWFDEKGIIEQADNLYNRLLKLDIEDEYDIPYLKALDSLMNANISSRSLGIQKKIKLELMLTAQYCVLSDILASQNNPDVIKEVNWKLQGEKLSYLQYVDRVLSTSPKQIKVSQSPINRQYELLKIQLKKYRELEQKDRFFKIKLDKTSYKLGDSVDVVRLIKLRLIDLGDLEDSNPSPIFNIKLESAVKQFQMRHGLLEDGIVGKATLAELNVNYNQRIKQIIVNMERCMWVPENSNNDYLAVNIPEFKLHVFSNNQLQWSCKVVVGKVMNKTVVFNADLKSIVFSPYWNVPQSIVKKEILKDMRKDKNYLAKHQMEITSYRNGLPEIRQKPGPLNALGKVKFLFPNSYNIYLHDTPSKSLFDEPVRAFSHGCIRVSEPFKLAQFLLRNQANWDDKSIQEAMDSGKERYVNLNDKVSVFIVYFTSFVDSEGKINFRKDIYGRDERLLDMIMDDY